MIPALSALIPIIVEKGVYMFDNGFRIYFDTASPAGWYIERLNDPSSGKAIPEEVLAKRAEVVRF